MQLDLGNKEYTMNIRQSIVTRILPPTNTLDARVKAQCDRGQHVMAVGAELEYADACRLCAAALLVKFAHEDGNDRSFGLIDSYEMGALPRKCEGSYVFVRKASS